jgi:putative tricarboxylic transport membrane protein
MSDAAPASQKPFAALLQTGFLILLVAFSAFYLWQTQYVPDPPRNILIGPRTFPRLIGGLMLLVSLLLLWRHLRPSAKADAEGLGIPSDAEGEGEVTISDWPAVWAVLASLVALSFLLVPLGFTTTIALTLFGLSTFFAPKHWLRNLIVAVTFSVTVYLLFTLLLGIPLPNGILEPLF